MADDSDESIIHTALRETEEEIGVNHRKVEIWATTPPLPDQVSSHGKKNNCENYYSVSVDGYHVINLLLIFKQNVFQKVIFNMLGILWRNV